jgi:uncharacterized phage-associated protein
VRTSVHDAADELRRRVPAVEPAKLHKLLYYVQGWHLAFFGEPWFDATVEAWACGPAVPDLPPDDPPGAPTPHHRAVDTGRLACVDFVVERYGLLSTRDLIRLAQAEEPWRSVSESEDDAVGPRPPISHDALRDWFQRDPDHRAFRVEVDHLRRWARSQGADGHDGITGVRAIEIVRRPPWRLP